MTSCISWVNYCIESCGAEGRDSRAGDGASETGRAGSDGGDLSDFDGGSGGDGDGGGSGGGVERTGWPASE
jgi:hypothetical protein